MFRHDAETFFQRGFMVAGSHPFVQIINESKPGVVQALGFFHNTDAPVKVGRETVLQVVGMLYSQFPTGKEGLMTDQHALLETLPIQFFGSRKSAHVKEMAFFIDDGCLSINHIRKFRMLECMHDSLQSLVVVELIAGIQEAEIVAGGQTDTLVHGIVQAFVGFADYLADPVAVFLHDFQRIVFRISVYDDILHIPVGLENHALDGIFQYLACMVGNGNDGELGMWV